MMHTTPKALAKFCKHMNADDDLRKIDIDNEDDLDYKINRLIKAFNKMGEDVNGDLPIDARVWYLDIGSILKLYRTAIIKRRAVIAKQ